MSSTSRILLPVARPDDRHADPVFGDEPPTGPGAPLFDVALVADHLRDAARQGLALSYSDLLARLGYRFTRPKMRALCKLLDAIDREGAARGEPELAVLVVREGDGLPGQGWWTGRHDYAGAWTGDAALAYVRALQADAFAYWRGRATPPSGG